MSVIIDMNMPSSCNTCKLCKKRFDLFGLLEMRYKCSFEEQEVLFGLKPYWCPFKPFEKE